MDRIDRVLATKANRPCLLSLKIASLLNMDDMQRLEETVETFIKVAPDNPLAHLYAALLETRKDRPRAAVDALQAALSRDPKHVSGDLFDTIGHVADALLRHGQYLAARGHLLFRAVVFSDEKQAVNSLFEVSGAGDVPLLLKRDLAFVPAPRDVPWQKRFDVGVEQSNRGIWKSAIELFEELDQKHPGQAPILENIAMARSYLAHPQTAEAWHNYAALDTVDFDQALAAEATSQLLDYEANQKMAAFKKVVLTVADASALQEKLLSSRQIVSQPVDPKMRQDDLPPPKSLLTLLDRPFPADDEPLTAEQIPRMLAQILLFGKETDREARLELLVVEGERRATTEKILAEIAGDLLPDGEQQEEILETLPLERLEYLPALQMPERVTFAERRRLIDEAASAAFQEKWPTLPLTVLDDKTPQDVAGDPAYQVPLAAALLVLEERAELYGWPANVDRLREQLGVPLPETIDSEKEDVSHLAPDQLHRVETQKLTDDQLQHLYVEAVLYTARTATRQLGTEVLRREHLSDQLDMANVAGEVGRLEPDMDRALTLFQRAQTLDENAGKSPARWYLAELPLRLLRGEVSEVQHILTVLQTRHWQEPGVADSVVNILKQFGIDPVERGGGRPGEAAPSAAAAEPEPAQKLWTPDSDQSATGAKKESKLWIPGMDE